MCFENVIFKNLTCPSIVIIKTELVGNLCIGYFS